ncbi:putative dipeptidyl-aminopeptidase B [Drechslerella stenobrocha 248]|uniref:dipeptidyl-peptidase IV n=1 Tax=Drechslerella stenobrocha 248 TaxID=1043628 RepID=W7HP94_9PEZI|nr:putative dipeptidyl-aminopeptidase B [Drechslerella stenobrocha 248]
MSTSYKDDDEARVPLRAAERHSSDSARRSLDDSSDTDSTTSLVLERLNRSGVPPAAPTTSTRHRHPDDEDAADYELTDIERAFEKRDKPMESRIRRMIWIIGGLLVGGWLLAMAIYIIRDWSTVRSPGDPEQTKTTKAGKKIDLDMVQGGQFRANHHSIKWIASPDGSKDGLMLEERGSDGFLVVKDVKDKAYKQVLMEDSALETPGNNGSKYARRVWPSPDLSKVLVATDYVSNFRHSFYATYYLYDVRDKKVSPLHPGMPQELAQLAVWAPSSNAVAFIMDNNLYLRKLPGDDVVQITKDGGTEYFYGVPDWVYEEEVFAGNTATWWSLDSKFIAFLRTNETQVPEFPVQYFLSRPSGESPAEGLEKYPEERRIKYPKAGAPNPTVDILFYDLDKDQTFTVDIKDDFNDLERLVTEVVWAGNNNVLVRETNRESDILKMVLINVGERAGKIVREVDINAIDGGWFEVSQHTTYIPADPKAGRPSDGYIDTVVHEGYDHLAYFTPLDQKDPVLLTSGKWEVVDAPSAVSLDNQRVYFSSTKKSSIERHIYSVKLDGTDLTALTNVTSEGMYDASFSSKAGYALLSYNGPGIPWQKVIETDPASQYEEIIEKNKELKTLVSQYELPKKHYSTITIDGFELNVVERRPPHFNPKLRYPVLFQVYGGPGSQQVSKSFNVDFQSYIAAKMNYIVVTVDGRGTGYIGRKARVCIRGDLGKWEAHDQIEAAKIWAAKKYTDEKRFAIWGWSFGGFLTLKTLELDAGQTFQYGMAVAPVTDWRFYDSVYTERYMHTPQHNPQGYDSSAINNVQALGKNVRFLLMHGVADDNVHFQNSLTLLDKLDLGGIENYDVHVFPDSDHSIYFHNANRIVYDKLATWLLKAFNREYLNQREDPLPLEKEVGKLERSVQVEAEVLVAPS